MKTILYLNSKRTSQKAIKELIGKDRLKDFIERSKESFMQDPLEQQSFFLGREGILTIEFK